MTCKDCYYYDVCMDYTSLKESKYAQNFNGSEVNCDHFKDKFQVVELPCKVGDIVYICASVDCGKDKFEIWKGEVKTISCEIDGIWVFCRFECGLTY